MSTGGPDYYREQAKDYVVDEVREIQRKQLIKEGKKLLVNRFTKNSPVARHLQECVNFMEQDHGL